MNLDSIFIFKKMRKCQKMPQIVSSSRKNDKTNFKSIIKQTLICLIYNYSFTLMANSLRILQNKY